MLAIIGEEGLTSDAQSPGDGSATIKQPVRMHVKSDRAGAVDRIEQRQDVRLVDQRARIVGAKSAVDLDGLAGALGNDRTSRVRV